MTRKSASWRQHVKTGSDWVWSEGKLWHKAASKTSISSNPTGWVGFLVKFIYADQNQSRNVHSTIKNLLSNLPDHAVCINVGAGITQYKNVVNIEIRDGENIDIIGFGSAIPFLDCSVDLLITQEVLEHIGDYNSLMDEAYRVLKPGGRFYCQVPFQIGFHPGPYDYWRFSRQGLEFIFSPPKWDREIISITLGHGSGFYRIAVEFLAVTISCLNQRLYRPTKALAAIMLYPVKFFDLLTPFSQEKDRIPGGYFCIARKV
jgi:SAM-dependent methyltransferase